MKPIRVHVVRKAAGATDSGNEDYVLAGHALFGADLGENPLHLRQDGVVSTSWPPPHYLIASKIGLCVGRGHDAGFGHGGLQKLLDLGFDFFDLEGLTLIQIVFRILSCFPLRNLQYTSYHMESVGCSCSCLQNIPCFKHKRGTE